MRFRGPDSVIANQRHFFGRAMCLKRRNHRGFVRVSRTVLRRIADAIDGEVRTEPWKSSRAGQTRNYSNGSAKLRRGAGMLGRNVNISLVMTKVSTPSMIPTDKNTESVHDHIVSEVEFRKQAGLFRLSRYPLRSNRWIMSSSRRIVASISAIRAKRPSFAVSACQGIEKHPPQGIVYRCRNPHGQQPKDDEAFDYVLRRSRRTTSR